MSDINKAFSKQKEMEWLKGVAHNQGLRNYLASEIERCRDYLERAMIENVQEYQGYLKAMRNMQKLMDEVK